MKDIKFIKEFVSPVYGNVWLGRKLKVSPKEAAKLVDSKLAELDEVEKQTPVKKEVDNGDSKPKRSKRAPKSGSKRRG